MQSVWHGMCQQGTISENIAKEREETFIKTTRMMSVETHLQSLM